MILLLNKAKPLSNGYLKMLKTLIGIIIWVLKELLKQGADRPLEVAAIFLRRATQIMDYRKYQNQTNGNTIQ